MDVYDDVKNLTLNRHGDAAGFATFTDLVDVPVIDVISKVFTAFEYYPWIFSLIGSMLVGLSGILPLLIIPVEEGENLQSGAGAKRLRILLSFAVGGLLGDVFLHLLPEAWESSTELNKDNHPSMFCGLWVLVGMLVFVIVQKLFSNQEDGAGEGKKEESAEGDDAAAATTTANNAKRPRLDKQLKPAILARVKDKVPNYIVNNNNTKYFHGEATTEAAREHHHISGYLNLMANSIDNFTHGLAIGGSFCISFKIGVLSTIAILVHEIPHEVGDFAILLKSGFSRWDAAKAQVYTASAGIFGSMTAVALGSSDSIQSSTSWILPFTAGGFLHIALVTVLPELIKEKSGLESFKQFASLFFGIVVMAVLIVVTE